LDRWCIVSGGQQVEERGKPIGGAILEVKTLTESASQYSKILLYIVLAVWGISLLLFIGGWLFVLGNTLDFHINLIVFTLLVAGAVPLAIIVLRIRRDNLLLGNKSIAGIILLWEAALFGVLLFWGLLVMTSTHMSQQQAAALKANFNIAFIAHVLLGFAVLALGRSRK